jgi:hypothetical protein
MRTRSRIVWVGLTTALFLSPGGAKAEVPVQRTRFELPSSNGFGAVLLDLGQRKLTHFREHVFATEEPLIDAAGNDVWTGAGFGSVDTRDLLYDAYFGVRVAGDQAWLPSLPADLDGSGFAGYSAGKQGGTGLARLVQNVGPLRLVTTVFAPRGLDHASFVMALEVTNTSVLPVTGVEVFSLHNFHLGYGRSGVSSSETAENGETIELRRGGGQAPIFWSAASQAWSWAAPLGAVKHHAAANASTPGAEPVCARPAAPRGLARQRLGGHRRRFSVSAYQWGLGTLAARQTEVGRRRRSRTTATRSPARRCRAGSTRTSGRRTPALVAAELAEWATLQRARACPLASTPEEETLLRHSAAILRMGQIRGQQLLARRAVKDGEPRRTRFGTVAGGPAATLPATVKHRGKGAVIASLPPGRVDVRVDPRRRLRAAAMAALGMRPRRATP